MPNPVLNPQRSVPQLPVKHTSTQADPPRPEVLPPIKGFAADREPGAYGGSFLDPRPGVLGEHLGKGYGVYGESKGGVGIYGRGDYLAGYFVGDVTIVGKLAVEGDIEVWGAGSDIRLVNADCAEDFDIFGADQVEPGSVMVFGEDGALRESQVAYDTRVAGVISGAGDYKPAIVLDGRRTTENRQPVALMGKVFCKVDADLGPIRIGDLLTTSPVAGHAMVVTDPHRAFGAVVGKAMRPLQAGRGLIPILVSRL